MAARTRWLAVVLVAVLGGAIPAVAAAEGAQSGSTPLADDPTMIALAVALACADAPDVIEAPPAEPAPGHETEGPELELVATVRAKALRFEDVPKVDVAFKGNGKRKTVWKTERVNLPARPEPGVTYRDVHVRLTITTNFEELGSMLQQAKRASRGIRIEQEGPPASAKAPATPAAPLAAAPARAVPVVSPPAPVASEPAKAAPATSPAAPAAPLPAMAAPPSAGAVPAASPPASSVPPPSPAPPAPVAPAR